MGRKQVYGKCRLCGKEDVKLTFEHFPPAKAMNNTRVNEIIEDDWYFKLMTLPDDIMPWETGFLKQVVRQKGHGNYILCADCNNKLGTWYMDEYVTFAKAMHYILSNNDIDKNQSISFNYKMHPLRFIKAIIAMFNDIGASLVSNKMRNWLLDKDCTDFDEECQIYMVIIGNNSSRTLPISGMLVGDTHVIISEFSWYPLSFILIRNKPDNIVIPGVDITWLAKYTYEDERVIRFENLRVHEINSPVPCDYRDKAKIIEDRRKNIDIRDGINKNTTDSIE